MLNKTNLLKDFENFCLNNEIEKNKSAYLLGLVIKNLDSEVNQISNEEYKTMFEYFGKPQGKVLNESTYKTALREGIKVNKKEVNNKNYNGFVMSYPISFLDSIFNPNNSIKSNTDDDLPF